MKKLIFLTILLNVLFCFAQDKTITGVVSDGKGPLSGVSITIKDSKYSTSTGFDGTYSITAREGQTLIFSFIGAKEVSKIVGKSNVIDVILQDDSTKTLNEVVVTSLGIKKSKKALTYAAQELKAEELTNSKDPNLINTLGGKVAGVVINKSAGGSGGSTKVTIRGNSSVNNNQPLYVIDGIPLLNISSIQPNDSFGNTQGGNRDGGDVTSLLNPDDYDGITILKGASAAALYGSQGARGVILLNSKKVKPGTTSLKVSSNTTFENVAFLPKFQNQYIAKPGADESWGAKQDNVDHVKDFFDTGITQISSINFATASEISSTILSYANTTSKGVIPTNELAKDNFSAKQTGYFFDNQLRVNANVNYVAQKINNKPVTGLYFNPLTGLYLMPRGENFEYYKTNFEVFDPTRNLMAQNWMTDRDIEQNPYWVLNRNASIERNQFFNGAIGLDYKVNKWLSIASRFNYDRIESQFSKFIYATTQGTLSDKNGRYIDIKDVSSQKYDDLIATINTNFNDDFNLNANIGTSITETFINDETVLDSNPNGLIYTNWFTLNNFKDNVGNYQNYGSKKQVQSIFAAATLGYKNMIYLDLGGRKDWSSALVNASNVPFYSTLGTTFILSDIFSMPKSVFGKIRGSFAKVGNDIPSFYTTPLNTLTSANTSTYNPLIGPRPGVLLKPEDQSSFELGTEWRFFENRLGFEITYYNNKTKNQLLSIPAPSTNPYGYQNYAFNGGTISNQGIEAILYGKILKSDKFNWDATLNFAKNTNKVTDLPDELGGKVVLTAAGVNNYRYVLQNDQPYGIIEGVNIKRDSQGRIMLNADGTIQKTGFENVGNANPDFMIGFQNSFKLGSYFLNFTIDGRFGGNVMSLTQAINDEFGVSKETGDARNNGGIDINAVYPNGSAYVGKYPTESYYLQTGGRAGATGEYVYSATNVSFRELSLGYKFDLSKTKYLKSASLSFVARNLFFIYKKAPFDPNISLSTGNGLQGIDVYGMPSTRSIGLNLNVSF